jgi:hypothetical protein
MFKITPVIFLGEPEKRFAVIVDGRKVVELPRRMPPIRAHVAPFVAALRGGKLASMATVLPDGQWSAFEAGRL